SKDQVVRSRVNREHGIADPSGRRRVLPDVFPRRSARGIALHRPVQGDGVSEPHVDAVAIVEGFAAGALLHFSDDGVKETERAWKLLDGPSEPLGVTCGARRI